MVEPVPRREEVALYNDAQDLIVAAGTRGGGLSGLWLFPQSLDHHACCCFKPLSPWRKALEDEMEEDRMRFLGSCGGRVSPCVAQLLVVPGVDFKTSSVTKLTAGHSGRLADEQNPIPRATRNRRNRHDPPRWVVRISDYPCY